LSLRLRWCANAGLHADQTRRQVGKSGLHLAARPLLAQHNGTTLIVAHNVERVLADIDADDGDGSLGGLGHGVLLVVGAPCQLSSLTGQDHGRTIPLADLDRFF
jgi:hypothetical protein